jgi:hypothetical protein
MDMLYFSGFYFMKQKKKSIAYKNLVKKLVLICNHKFTNVLSYKEGRGIRPDEALATLRFIEEVHTFYHSSWKDN